MKTYQFNRILKYLHKLTKEQYKTLQIQLNEVFTQPNVIFANLQKALDEHPQCPHCQSDQIIHFGLANNLPRYRCTVSL